MYQIPLNSIIECLRISIVLCFMAENKSNKQHFERALSKIFDEVWTHDAERTAKVMKQTLVVDSQDAFSVLPTGFGKSPIYQVLPALFSDLHRFRHVMIKNFAVAVVSPLEYIRVKQVETLRKLVIQAVCLDPSFDDETNYFN